METGTLWAAVAALGVWVGIIGAVLWFGICNYLEKAIAAAIIALNGTYLRSAGSPLTGHEISGKIESLEERMGSMEQRRVRA